ncbi:MAG: potassium channel family protein [Phycisphaerales bacterium]|nr:potassium channel family protein [Phycisphaerales bacterium]
MTDEAGMRSQPGNSSIPSDGKRRIEPFGFLRLYFGGRYIWIMTGLFLLMIMGPLLGRFEIISTHIYVGDILIGGVLLAAIRAFIKQRRHFVTCTLLGFIAIGIGLLGRYLPSADHRWFTVFALSFDTLLLAYLILLIGADVFTTAEVEADTICGSISVYLLISGVFASVYSILLLLDSSAFILPEEPIGVDISLGPDRLMAYFSLITITTVGYGDITPKSELARSLANLEAIVGQVFLTVLVARLVGTHLSLVTRNRSARSSSPSA